MDKLILRKIRKEDCKEISDAFKSQNWYKPESQYERYLELQEIGEKDVIIAELDGKFAGYLTIDWDSKHIGFKEKGIPEIVDLNVLKKYQRQGIATSLMDEAERRIKIRSAYSGIGFGVTKDYGAAQILYISRNYKPDGNGITKESRSLKNGEEVIIGDDLVFYLSKRLR